ncbi:MAG: hypothetical protein P8Q90_06030 [Candidatus Thalassarchaeaceae archaeon]|nr:hypothetical protein [Candidatus Thalassarchaeaceae archaeon]
MRRAYFFTLLFLAAMLQYTPPVEGQILPDVEITCTPTEMEIDVSPLSDRTTVTECRAENPTIFVEDVIIQINAGGLSYSSPGEITVNGGSSTDFWVSFRGDASMEPQNLSVTLSYRVDTANGVQCITCTSKQITMSIAVDEFTATRNGTNATEETSMWSGSKLGEYFFFLNGFIIFPIIILALVGIAYAIVRRNNGAVGRA